MFYIDHIENGMYAVADSDDGVIDLISQKELNEYIASGVAILPWEQAKLLVTGRMTKNCNYNLWRKLQRGANSGELVEYLGEYSVYHIADILNKYQVSLKLDKSCKIFDYTGTSNYFIFTVYLSDNTLLVVEVTSDYEVIVLRLNSVWHFEKYPSCAGNLISRLAKKYSLDMSGVVYDEPYLLLYSLSNTEICLVNHYSMQTILIHNAGGNVLC